jgi:hypothetical protein
MRWQYLIACMHFEMQLLSAAELGGIYEYFFAGMM